MTENATRPCSWESIEDFTFFFYDPWFSLFGGVEPRFRNSKGEDINKPKRDVRRILQIACEAAQELSNGNPSDVTRDEWRSLVAGARELVAQVRDDLPALGSKITFVDEGGVPLRSQPMKDEISPETVANLLTQALEWDGPPDSLKTVCREIWGLVCLSWIDSALLAQMYDDAGDGVAAMAAAMEALAHAKKLGEPPPAPTMAELGARAKLAADPKQAAKLKVRECWDLWQAHPARYKGKAAFARDMLTKYESLTSQAVIEAWCRKWERNEPA